MALASFFGTSIAERNRKALVMFITQSNQSTNIVACYKRWWEKSINSQFFLLRSENGQIEQIDRRYLMLTMVQSSIYGKKPTSICHCWLKIMFLVHLRCTSFQFAWKHVGCKMTGMHMWLIRLWDTFKRREINPKSINSVKNRKKIGHRSRLYVV